ncbi:MAG: hypothetical protein R3337_00340 [Gammaproteobacteria bacterium]|nr:hypothetical protein [Gammaproteobacteria bacterium]
MHAFAGATRQETYPDNLRPFIELVLEQHFAEQSGSSNPLGVGISVTEATKRRCERGSTRTTVCSLCKGAKTQTIRGPTKDIDIPCPKCFGEGEFGCAPKQPTGPCERCNGSGVYRPEKLWAPKRVLLELMAKKVDDLCREAGATLAVVAMSPGDWPQFLDKAQRELAKMYRTGKKRPLQNQAHNANTRYRMRYVQGRRRWNANPDFDPPLPFIGPTMFEPAECTSCRGTGWVGGLDAQPVSPAEGGGPPAVAEPTSEVGDVLIALEGHGTWESRTVLELAFGEVGRYVTRRLCEPRSVALWPVTKPGRALMRLFCFGAGRPHKTLVGARESVDPTHQALVSTAELAAVGLLEVALAQLYVADQKAAAKQGKPHGPIQRRAERLFERGESWR